MASERCKKLVTIIENDLSNIEKEELFKILHKNHVNYTKNNNGIFINLAWLSDSILDDIEKYVQFCYNSQVTIHKYESICDLLRGNIGKDTKEIMPPNTPISKPVALTEIVSDRLYTTSSSVRFALYKKKFAKMSAPDTHESDLKADQYICV